MSRFLKVVTEEAVRMSDDAKCPVAETSPGTRDDNVSRSCRAEGSTCGNSCKRHAQILKTRQANKLVTTGVNSSGDAGGRSPNILVGESQWKCPQAPILLRTFGRSRPILVVLAQWQHLTMSFIHCFARKSKICHIIDLNPTEGAHNKEKL